MTAEQRVEKITIEEEVAKIMEERTPNPEEVVYEPVVEFFPFSNVLTREEIGKAIAMGDRTAISYKNLAQKVMNEKGKPPVEIEGEQVDATTAFYLQYALAARSKNEIAHTSILEQVNMGDGELGGDSPIIVEGVSVLAALRDICSLRHFGFEAFSSRGGIFPENYWKVPTELSEAGIGQELEAINSEVHSIYLHLTEKGICYYLKTLKKHENEKNWQFRWRVLSHALDDSRQVTNQTFLNHFSMHPNSALSLREALVKLSSSQLPETRQIASRLRELAKQSLPNLMRYTEESPYINQMPEKRKWLIEQLSLEGTPKRNNLGRVGRSRLIEAQVTLNAEKIFLAAFIAKNSGISFGSTLKSLEYATAEEINKFTKEIFKDITLHDKPPEELEMIQIVGSFEMSIGAIYEAIRHRLATHIVGSFSPYFGYTIPDVYLELGLGKDYLEAIKLNERAYFLVSDLGAEFEEVFGPYFTARAHLVPVTIRISVCDLFHMLKIRATEGAHSDIRNPMTELEEAMRESQVYIFNQLVKKT